MRFAKLGLLLLCCLLLGACATNAAIREEFEKSVKGYNQMLRWQEVEAAGMTYMEPELREAFMKSAEDIRKKSVTITDYRILTSECLPDKGSASATAEFDYYILPSNRIKTLTYQQQWSYEKNNGKKGWLLKSGLPPFE
ncbi:MAG: hypothetical protein CXR30_04825 [Geobacter sp.]|nr:MAG: hypothetical protein CXR30_04825 [Geobacter sp.]